MSQSWLKKLVLLAVLVLPFVLYYIFVYSAEENFFQTLAYVGPRETTADGDTQYYQVPDWEYRTQHDSLLSNDDLRGKIYLVNFFFTSCPSICPAMNYNVQQIQERFKNYADFRIVSFSVDPGHDSVEVLRKYQDQIGARPGLWFFLTGEQSDIYQTAWGYFLNAMEDAQAEGGFLHSESLVLVDWEGRIRSRRDDNGNILGVYPALSPTGIGDLKSDIKVLIAEYEKQKSVDKYQAEKALKRKNSVE